MFNEKSEIRDFYNGNVSRLAGEIASRKMRNRLFVAGELASFVAAVIAFVAWASGGLRAPLLILALLLDSVLRCSFWRFSCSWFMPSFVISTFPTCARQNIWNPCAHII